MMTPSFLNNRLSDLCWVSLGLFAGMCRNK